MAGRSTLIASSSLADSVTSQFWSWMPTSATTTTRSDYRFWFLGHGDIDAHVDPTKKAVTSLCGKDEIGGWKLSLEHSPDEGGESKKVKKTRSVTTPRADEGKDGESTTPLANPSIRDPLRSWVISAGWLIASSVEYVLKQYAI
jgi:hypothetical protein